MNYKKDKLFSDPTISRSEFVFDEQVADIFPDMITRSVPGYRTIIEQIGMLACRYVIPNTHIYDLGCSLGAVTLSISRSITQQGCKIYAVDNSEAMVKRCNAHCERDTGLVPVEVICADIQDVEMINASFTVLNFTLQFIEPDERNRVVENIFNGLVSGGCLILSEKISVEDDARQDLLDRLYHDFKRYNGYSELEISRKREALENVLKRESDDIHRARLKSVGFTFVEEWFRCFNFISFLAIK